MIKKVRLLQYQGVDEFGLIYDVVTRDIFGEEGIRQCIYDSINEIFKGISLYNWSAIWLCYTQAGIDIQNYDYLLLQLYNRYKDQPKKTMLEIGPGVGVFSLTLKKLLDIDISWLTLRDDEQQWSIWRSSAIRRLYDKYDIHIKEANVETEEFDGYYDIIFMSQVLEHFIFNPVPTIKKLMAHLNDDGRIFMAFPTLIYNDPPNVESYREMPYYEDLSSKEATRRSVINNLTHFHEYTFEEAMELFDECGLECIAHHMNSPIMHFVLKKK